VRRKRRTSGSANAAREIRPGVRHVLPTGWGYPPIGVRDVPEARDNTYVFDVYGLLVSGALDQDTVPYLYSVETPSMVALCGIDVSS
jgi:hypothetical protein